MPSPTPDPGGSGAIPVKIIVNDQIIATQVFDTEIATYILHYTRVHDGTPPSLTSLQQIYPDFPCISRNLSNNDEESFEEPQKKRKRGKKPKGYKCSMHSTSSVPDDHNESVFQTPPTYIPPPAAPQGTTREGNNPSARPTSPSPPILIQISGLPPNITTKQIITAIAPLNFQINDIRTGRNSVVISSPNPNALNLISCNKHLFGKNISVSQIARQDRRGPRPANFTPSYSAVVKHVESDVTDEEFKEALQKNNIAFKNTWRIISRATGKATTLFRVVSADKGSIDRLLADGLIIFFKRHPAEESHPPAAAAEQCNKCMRYDHPTQECRQEYRCAHCGENHPRFKCPKSNQQPHCVNCGQAHSARAWGCEKRPTNPAEITRVAPVKLDVPPIAEEENIDPPSKDVQQLVKVMVSALATVLPEKRREIAGAVSDAMTKLYKVRMIVNYSRSNMHISFPPVRLPYSGVVRASIV